MMRLVPCFAGALHAPKLGAFGDLPAMFDGKAKALVQRDIMFVGGFQIGAADQVDAVGHGGKDAGQQGFAV